MQCAHCSGIFSLNYERYYGEKDGLGFAGIFDLLSRLGSTGKQLVFGRRILDWTLEPWLSQKEPVPVVSKWKRVRPTLFHSIFRGVV